MTESRVMPAKEPRSIIAGPYGHPFHPLLVTVPIGTWVASLVFDIVSKAGDEPDVFAKGSAWLIGIGIVGAVVAAIFGLLDLTTLPRGTRAFTTAITHMTLNVIVLALFVVNLLIRRDQGFDEVTTTQLVLTIVALALLSVSGWLGGRMSYRYGVRVADETTQAEGYRTGTR